MADDGETEEKGPSDEDIVNAALMTAPHFYSSQMTIQCGHQITRIVFIDRPVDKFPPKSAVVVTMTTENAERLYEGLGQMMAQCAAQVKENMKRIN